MKKLIKDSIAATSSIRADKYVFTIKDIKNLLYEMKELKDFDIDFKPGQSGAFKITVGNSAYQILGMTKNANIYGES